MVPRDQNNNPYENHYPGLSELDSLAIGSFLESNIGAFQDHLATLGMDPEDADMIIRGLK